MHKKMHETSCIMPVDNTRTFVYYIIRNRGNPNEKEINKMSQNEMISKIEQLREWETLLEEAQSEVEALRDSIKAEMLEQGTEEMQVGAYIIRWTSVLSNRFDSTSFKKEYADLYKTYTKQVASKRFSIA